MQFILSRLYKWSGRCGLETLKRRLFRFVDALVKFRVLGIGIVAYSPLCSGFFGGKAVTESLPANSFLATHPRFTGDTLDRIKLLYERVASLAANYVCSAPRLASSWILHQGVDVIPIPGTTKIKNLLENNIGSLKVRLKPEKLEEISGAVPINEVAGARIYEMMDKHSWKFTNIYSCKA